MTAIWSAPTIRRSATLDERGCQVSGRHGSRSEVEVEDDEENCCLDMIWFVYLVLYLLFSAECVGSNRLEPSPAKKSEIFHVSKRIAANDRRTDTRHVHVSECSTDRSALRSRQIIHDFDYCHVVLPTLTLTLTLPAANGQKMDHGHTPIHVGTRSTAQTTWQPWHPKSRCGNQ